MTPRAARNFRDQLPATAPEADVYRGSVTATLRHTEALAPDGIGGAWVRSFTHERFDRETSFDRSS